ncbi:MAG: hypothetical protein NC428_10030 [Clostridium sp.]|nr:hypothetical protein [Clostridium sp.]
MKSGSMEALLGASYSAKMVDVPMKSYKEANRNGDIGGMERAMGYVSAFTSEAYDYKEKAQEELVKEQKEERKKQELERENAVEKRKKEARKIEKGLQSQRTSDSKDVKSETECAAETSDVKIYDGEGNAVLLEDSTPNLVVRV